MSKVQLVSQSVWNALDYGGQARARCPSGLPFLSCDASAVALTLGPTCALARSSGRRQ